MILMILYTKVQMSSENRVEVVETAAEKNVSSGPESLLLGNTADVLTAENTVDSENEGAPEDESEQNEDEDAILGPAEKMDMEKARKESHGLVVELDYVSENRISLHGTFGYMAFSLTSDENGVAKAMLENAVTLEELGGLTMGGTAYTDVLGGDGCALIVPGIRNEEIARRRRFLYIEETNEITGGIVAPDWMMEKAAAHDYSDAVTEEAYVRELAGQLASDHDSKLLYGPVVIPESNSNGYGFLAEDGEHLEDLWYGIWNRDLDIITKVQLFE